jgi:toxin YhaV
MARPAAPPPVPPVVVNGWTLFGHALFLDQLEALAARVAALRRKDPKGYTGKNDTKRLAGIAKLAFEVIPQDPGRADYRQGEALGPEYRHWFRAKFFQQYRLFFRYRQADRIIVYAWVNDDSTLRAYESPDDAYRVFRGMLDRGHPPDGWEALLAQAKREGARLSKAKG